MDYDVLVLGGGLVGCAVSYELSKYSLNIALIEKDYDIVDDVALVNSAIVYDGIQCESSIMAKLQFMGNEVINDLCNKFNIPYRKQPSLFLAMNEEEKHTLEEIYDRAIKRGIPNIALLDGKYISELDPKLNITPTKILYSQNTGVISPYELGIAYGEVAFDNGVAFKLEEKVENITKINKGFKVETNKNKFTCRMVINTTPEDYNIDGFKETIYENSGYLKYFLIEKDKSEYLRNTMFVRDEDDYMYLYPTVQNNFILAVKTTENLNYNQCYKKISKYIDKIKPHDIHSFYETYFHDDTIVIDDSFVHKGYIKIAGKNYTDVTMTPSVAKVICETVVSNLNCKFKNDFNDKRREVYKFKDMSNDERKKIISLDKRYGKIICMCNMVTEGEIIDSIRRPLGARTVEGIKRRTGAGAGSCRSSHCLNKIVSILARETNKELTDIVKDSKRSNIILNRIKEFDEM